MNKEKFKVSKKLLVGKNTSWKHKHQSSWHAAVLQLWNGANQINEDVTAIDSWKEGETKNQTNFNCWPLGGRSRAAIMGPFFMLITRGGEHSSLRPFTIGQSIPEGPGAHRRPAFECTLQTERRARAEPCSPQGCQFWPFRGQKKQLWPFFFKLVGHEIFENLPSVWPFLSLQKFIYDLVKHFSFLKAEHIFGIFQSKAPGNPGSPSCQLLASRASVSFCP